MRLFLTTFLTIVFLFLSLENAYSYELHCEPKNKNSFGHSVTVTQVNVIRKSEQRVSYSASVKTFSHWSTRVFEGEVKIGLVPASTLSTKCLITMESIEVSNDNSLFLTFESGGVDKIIELNGIQIDERLNCVASEEFIEEHLANKCIGSIRKKFDNILEWAF